MYVVDAILKDCMSVHHFDMVLPSTSGWVESLYQHFTCLHIIQSCSQIHVLERLLHLSKSKSDIFQRLTLA